ncbi:MAG: SURF1 family protein [Pseudomonadota bacterium]
MFAGSAHFRFNWKLTLFTVLLFPLLVRLGFWQLEREQEKIQLQDLYSERQQQVPEDLLALDEHDDLQYRQVAVAGQYDNDHIFLLDNKIYQGQVGYEVIVPLLTGNGLIVFINRGWIPQGQYRDQLPEVPLVDGSVELAGSVYVAVGEQLVLGSELATADWPKVIQTLDTSALFMLAGYETESQFFPYSVRLDENSSDVLKRDWPVISTTPEKHRAYAVQWFAMAMVLLGLYLYTSFRPEPNSKGE